MPAAFVDFPDIEDGVVERTDEGDIFGGHTEHPLLPLHGDADLGALMSLDADLGALMSLDADLGALMSLDADLGALMSLERASLFAVGLVLLEVPSTVLRPLIGLSVTLRVRGGSSYTS